MAELEEALKKIKAKLKMLEFTQEDIPRIREKNELKALERLRKVLEEQIDNVHEQKVQIQAMRFEKGDQPEEIRKWTREIEEEVAEFDGVVEDVRMAAENLRGKALQEARDEEEKKEEEKRKRRYEDEIKLQEAKMAAKLEFEKKMEEARSKSLKESGAKLPKLIITKFQGTHLDWQRFWGQFETEIDKADITQVAKFSYLKELLIRKVRASVDGLPYNSEGYERAKNILRAKYGKASEVANAHMQCIIALPTIQGSQPVKIHEFYEKLSTNIQTLETMGKVKEINGYVRGTLDKLPSIRADLVRLDDDWQEWGFPQMLEALRKWCDRNPLPSPSDQPSNDRIPPKPPKRDRVFHSRQEEWKPRPCVYCETSGYKSVECDKIVGVAQRRRHLSEKRLCFNCTGTKHRVADCRMKTSCQTCGGRHHTSICDKQSQQIMLATGDGAVIYPVVVVNVNGITCRALLNTGAGSSYASAALVKRLGKQPARTEHKRIDMMMCSTTQKIEQYDVKISSICGKFEMASTVSKVDKGVLLSVPNPGYAEQINKYRHLEGVVMNDEDTKAELPIHLILGASDYSRIKTDTKPKIEKPGEPIAELTTLGWTMMSSGKETSLGSVYLTRTSSADYEQLSSLDVLGLQDRPDGDQQSVYDDFKEQLRRSDEGWYETGLLWKQGHAPLPNNKHGSLRRLECLLKKLQKTPNLLTQYDEVIQDQLAKGIVEKVTSDPVEREFYIPQKPVIRESAESTKLRIVFDASARSNERSPSLNDCLETGPPLQNLLWDVLVRNRLKPVALAGDLKQAFLQVRIRLEDRDALRFHWIKNRETTNVEVVRFTRALFGLVQSPFLLGGTLHHHLESLKGRYPSEVEEIMKNLYVDDVITGGETTGKVRKLKETAVAMFGEAQFELHKWHSNEPELEASGEPEDGKRSYAKEQLGVKPGETKMLGLPWDKTEDTIAVTFPEAPPEVTKREMLRFLASVYDPLGLASPVTLVGKLLYREVCERRLPWDQKVPESIAKQWNKFQESLSDQVQVPRSLAAFQETIEAIDLHAFGDTSGAGTAAAVYAVVHQASGINQGLLAAKARLAKKGLTIPRLELVSGHMAANLVENVKNALHGQPVRSIHGWLDSTVALHWIKGGRSTYKQFVANRVNKIRDKDYIEWRHVGTDQNPADVGS